MKNMLMKLTTPMIFGTSIITAGIIVYAMIKECTIEVKSPFFGEWKITPSKANS